MGMWHEMDYCFPGKLLLFFFFLPIHTFWKLTFLLRKKHLSSDMLLTKEPNLEWKIVSLWWLSFCQDKAKHFHLADASCEIDKTLGRKAYSIYVYVFPNDKFNRTFHPVLLIESQPKSTPLWQCAYHPCKDKATQTHTYTHMHISCFASVACWAGSLLQCQATSC